MILNDAICACVCAFAAGTLVWLKPDTPPQKMLKIMWICILLALMIVDLVLLAVNVEERG